MAAKSSTTVPAQGWPTISGLDDTRATKSLDPSYDGQAAVTFGGQLTALSDSAPPPRPVRDAVGSRVNISV
ncbi:hypothetical protein [Caulobacter sp. RL271]|jgi:hypothetical protein|uniref:Uncharacterized protein n=1 Tax=Caulobacter segnis TaxID=88688 RepID=A0ABY4ZMZ6_9CAUL|nr:hypothetical protein [Caulobacter segnis]USQ94178.1 hypothetical protein MZV50_16380 [Caulobacter segnis]